MAVLVVALLGVVVVAVSRNDDGTPTGAESTEDVDRGQGGSAAAGDDLRVVELGTFGSQATIPITLEDGDVSFLLTAVNDDGSEPTTVVEVVDPTGEVVHQAEDVYTDSPSISGPLTDVLHQEVGEVTLMVPAHPGYDVVPGTYEVTLDNVGSVDVTALVKSGDVSPEVRQAIDFNVWLALGGPLGDDARAALAADLRRGMNRILEPRNLEVGEITVLTAPPADDDEFAETEGDRITDACGAIEDEAGLGRAANIGLVGSVVDPEVDGTLLGLSSGLPGAVQADGATLTCVLVASTVDGADLPVDKQAFTMIHETSHFMGLTHTTEEDGTAVDDFADTPVCDIETYDGRDNLGYLGELNGLIDAVECGTEGGGDNYMFPLDPPPELVQDRMSADQAWALRRHPLFYPVG